MILSLFLHVNIIFFKISLWIWLSQIWEMTHCRTKKHKQLYKMTASSFKGIKRSALLLVTLTGNVCIRLHIPVSHLECLSCLWREGCFDCTIQMADTTVNKLWSGPLSLNQPAPSVCVQECHRGVMAGDHVVLSRGTEVWEGPSSNGVVARWGLWLRLRLFLLCFIHLLQLLPGKTRKPECEGSL